MLRFVIGGVMVTFLLCLLITAGCAPPPPAQSIQQIDTAKVAAVKLEYAHDKELVGAGIKVTVINQECTLEGSVASEEAKQRAEQLALKVKGITKVINKLEVKQ